nr:PREDICTED: protein Dok-7 isoform X4 [Lepisosteus oculatus]
MTDSVVVEGQVKYRDGKKWKSRWVALRKPSPVADCLLMLVYKDKSDKTKGHKERHSITLEDICGLEPGLSYEGVSYTLAIICLSETVMLGFESRDTMYAWDIRIRYSLGEVHRFNVAVLPGTKLETGPATLHLCNDLLVIVRDIPPAIIGQWKLSDLRRYGAVPNGFVFEGGTRCGYWAGVFFLSCAEGEQISFLFDCVVRGISPSRGPFGLRPALPDPNANPAYMEDRVSHEALELEKRLSLLSHSSRQSSTASSSSYSTSGTLGDDRSLSSSSSDTSHSDTSIGSRLAIWPEPSISSAPLEPHSLPAAKTVLHGEEKLHVEAMRGTRPPPKPPRSRKLQEIGRQSSSDSGIATGSHSSYSGSFSSYTGSLDICHGDEFGSLLSLPLNLASDQSWCTCQHGETQRVLGSEYQVPSSLRHLYDTPRSLLQAAASREAQSKSPDTSLPKDEAALSLLTSITDTKGATPELSSDRRLATSSSHESSRDSDETYVDLIPRWSAVQHPEQVRVPRSSEVVPSAGVSTDPCEICSPHPGVSRALFAACPICGGLKGTTLSHSGVLSMPAIPEKSSAKTFCCFLECSKPTNSEKTSKKNIDDECGLRNAGDDDDYEAIWDARSVPTTDAVKNRASGNLDRKCLQKGSEKGATEIKFHHKDISSNLFTGVHSSYWKISNCSENLRVHNLYEPMAPALRNGSLVSADITKGASILWMCSENKKSLGKNEFEEIENNQSDRKTDGLTSTPESGSLSDILSKYNARLQHPPGISPRSNSVENKNVKQQEHSQEMLSSFHFQPLGVDDQSQEISTGEESSEDKKPKKKDEKRKTDLAYEIMEGRGTEKPAEWDESSRYELMASYGHQKIFHETEDSKGSYELMTSTIEMPKRCEVTSGEYWGMSAISTDVQVPEKLRGEGVTYVNIPVSPTSKKQLHYMELELQEPGSGVRGGGSTKYAQIDITATETAHKVGTQHAQFREERLQELEQKKKVWKQKLMKTENPDLCHQMDTKWESGFSVELNCERDGAQLQPSYKRAPAKKTQRKRCKTLTPKSKRQKSNTALEWDERVLKSIWGREGKSGPFPCIFLPVAEDEFLEDMLADNPRYKSTSQQKPMEYWEKAAADLPVYQGPWKPSRSQNPPLW